MAKIFGNDKKVLLTINHQNPMSPAEYKRFAQ